MTSPTLPFPSLDELNKLIELQNQQDEKEMNQNDDIESSNHSFFVLISKLTLSKGMDIDEFENRLKMGKSQMGFDGDSDSDDDERPSSKLSSKKANILSSNKNNGFVENLFRLSTTKAVRVTFK